MVAISGDDAPSTTPVASAQRTWTHTAIFLLLGMMTFASLSVLPYPHRGEIDRPEQFHRPEAPPQPAGGGGGFRLFPPAEGVVARSTHRWTRTFCRGAPDGSNHPIKPRRGIHGVR